MSIIELMDKSPLWGMFLLSAAMILVSNESGFSVGKRQRRKDVSGDKIQTGPVVAASLGLLAFILAFSFGSVTSRYDDRKQLLLKEANAIGTAFLRADLLTEPDRSEMRRVLFDYVTLRVDLSRRDSLEEIQLGIEKSEEMQRTLWSRAAAIARMQQTPISALVLQSLNEVIDLHGERLIVVLHHRMPHFFWYALYGLTVLTMIVSGYDAGLKGGRRSITTLVAPTLAFSTILLLIIALDRPLHGLSTVNQAAMINLQQDMYHSMQNP